MSKNKPAPAKKTVQTAPDATPQSGWIKSRSGILIMVAASLLFGIFVLTQMVPQAGWGQALLSAAMYMAMMWGVFGIMMLFFRLTRRR